MRFFDKLRMTRSYGHAELIEASYIKFLLFFNKLTKKILLQNYKKNNFIWIKKTTFYLIKLNNIHYFKIKYFLLKENGP